jgi:hypothetical protein
MTLPARALLEHYRCPAKFLDITHDVLSTRPDFFRFGPNVMGYGRIAKSCPNPSSSVVCDLLSEVQLAQSQVRLPFDPAEVIENLQCERYQSRDSLLRRVAKRAYYQVRPTMKTSIREWIQKWQLRDWRSISFPGWPVDFTVENLREELLALVLRGTGAERIPFIWFWPQGKDACTIMTHDVEGETGRDYCADLMDVDDFYGIKASFNIVPRGSYSVSQRFLDSIRGRGFEIGVQDFNHDGRLFDERTEFLRRAKLINQYAREYHATGFRSAVLYRRPEWYQDLEFSFDMSIPNTARLDPQRGGCCSVMPYFIGDMVELPVTTVQDYTLYHLLSERSIELWRTQIGFILEKNGLISFIVHPDYVMDGEIKTLYSELLAHLREQGATKKIWFALPSEVDRWWRARSKMHLVSDGNDWQIEGEGAERACVAYARIGDGKLVYELQPAFAGSGHAKRKSN